MICQTYLKLRDIRHEKSIASSKAVATLTEKIGICAFDIYTRYQKDSANARREYEEAKANLDKHLIEHLCLGENIVKTISAKR